MKIIFVINSLEIGGGEKSLVSLLNTIDYTQHTVDLLMLKKGSPFSCYIPKEVKILEPPKYYKFLEGKYTPTTTEKVKFTISRLKSTIDLRINKLTKNKNNQQIFWQNQKKILAELKEKYNLAIAYSQGFPTYLVAEKIKAEKKITWINCDYTNTMYDKKYDKKFYEKYEKIIAVSENCKKSILNVFPKYENKVSIFKDIVNEELIIKMSKQNLNNKEIFKKSDFNILTVARLVIGYKGYDLLISTAKLLKDEGLKFKWYIVGDGQEKEGIVKLIKQNQLEKNVILLGGDINPYKYMSKCDLYVQTSRIEGFGLTVREAKIIGCKIICTNFNTAKEIIKNEEEGTIVEIDSKKIYEKIRTIMKVQ